jgi:hypothetical protein
MVCPLQEACAASAVTQKRGGLSFAGWCYQDARAITQVISVRVQIQGGRKGNRQAVRGRIPAIWNQGRAGQGRAGQGRAVCNKRSNLKGTMFEVLLTIDGDRNTYSDGSSFKALAIMLSGRFHSFMFFLQRALQASALAGLPSPNADFPDCEVIRKS